METFVSSIHLDELVALDFLRRILNVTIQKTFNRQHSKMLVTGQKRV